MSRILTRRVMLTGRTSSATPRWWTRAAGLPRRVSVTPPAGLLAQTAATGSQSGDHDGSAAPDSRPTPMNSGAPAESEKEDLPEGGRRAPDDAGRGGVSWKAAVANWIGRSPNARPTWPRRSPGRQRNPTTSCRTLASPKGGLPAEGNGRDVPCWSATGRVHPRAADRGAHRSSREGAYEAEAKEDWFWPRTVLQRLLLEEIGRSSPTWNGWLRWR